MTDKPIIFSAPMVRALIEGRKTQTRRVLKPQPCGTPELYEPMSDEDAYWAAFDADEVAHRLRIPYATGDRLWVREPIDKASDRDDVFYRADYEAKYGNAAGLGWRPSIHMPRWASRLTLKVTEVRVQRLQDISEADAVAEGCPCQSDDELAGMDPRGWFRDLWNSLHGPDAWDANPWVVAVSFTVEQRNIDA